jgi:mannose-6-phosphate isomerase-like protein (cupin superfamily)
MTRMAGCVSVLQTKASAVIANDRSEREFVLRRVVAAVGVNGKSYVASDEAIPDTGLVWTSDPKDNQACFDAIDSERIFRPAQPPPGGASWYLSELPAGKGMQREDDHPPGMDALGFHVTKTVDFIYVLSGTVILDLDRDTVELRAGDTVVLQAVNHAWRNPTDEPARLLDLMMCCEAMPVRRARSRR